jgi:hypothetical protein
MLRNNAAGETSRKSGLAGENDVSAPSPRMNAPQPLHQHGDQKGSVQTAAINCARDSPMRMVFEINDLSKYITQSQPGELLAPLT